MQYTSVQEKSELKNRMKYLGGNGMFKEMKKRVNNQKGLTLIELLAVIVILGIVAAIAIPSIGNIIDNSRIKAVKADAANVINAANIYRLDNGTLPTNLGDLKPKYLESAGSITEITSVTLDPTTKEITFSGSATLNGKTYSLSSVKLSTLQIDKPTTGTSTGVGDPGDVPAAPAEENS